jgi:hypothetical protein
MNEEETLNERQERFCQLYTGEKQFFGNWVQSYLEVYDIDRSKKNWYKTACAATSQLLSNIKVLNRINELLEEQGLNDQFADKQLLFLLSQHCDFTNKLWAIKEYNKLKGRIIDKIEPKIDINIYNEQKIKDLNDMIKRVEN